MFDFDELEQLGPSEVCWVQHVAGVGCFFEKVWVYCGKKQRFHSTVDVGASPQVLKMFLVNV